MSERAVVKVGKKNKRGDCANQSHQHIGLCVPHIALTADKIIRGRAGEQGGPPFDEFVEGAESEADCDDQEGEPSSSVDHPQANHQLS